VVETVMMQGGSLLWCAHHFAFVEDALDAFGATILVDERPQQPIDLRTRGDLAFVPGAFVIDVGRWE
jgi:hypothetical protein